MKVPESLFKNDKQVSRVLTALNIAVPLLEGVAYFFCDTTDPSKEKKFKDFVICIIASKFAVLILELISAGFLGLAIYKIRKFIKTEGNTNLISTIQLIQHFSAFALYLLSSLIMLIYWAIYYLGKLKTERLLVSIDIYNILSYFSQLCLCWIFWNLTKREPQAPQATEPVNEEHIEQEPEDQLHSIPEVITEDYDERCDLQARIWN